MQECDYVVPVSSSEDKDQSSSNSQAEFWKYIDINNVHQEVFYIFVMLVYVLICLFIYRFLRSIHLKCPKIVKCAKIISSTRNINCK